MPRTAWPDRLGRWLPPDVQHQWYRPALADARYLREQRRITHASSLAAAWRELAFAATVLGLVIECLRLTWSARLRRSVSVQTLDDLRSGLKETPNMFTLDLRRALRIFRLQPGFALVIVLTLAIGIGATTALFAVLEAALLRPLPYPDADRLVMLMHRDQSTGATKEFIAIGDYVDIRARQHFLEPLAGYGRFQATLLGDGHATRVNALAATPEFFTALRLQPSMGRLLTQDDARAGGQAVTMISEELWRTRFGSDPHILSRFVQIDDARRLVVGVLPAGFRFPVNAQNDVVVPLPVPTSAPAQRRSDWIFALGRLQSDRSIARANGEIDALSTQLAAEFPSQNQGSAYFVAPMRDVFVGDVKRPLLFLAAAVGLVWLIACVNVGNLLLGRAMARQHELVVRTALGAGTWRLVGQVIAESVVLATAGGAAGAAIAWFAAPILAVMVPAETQVAGLDHLRLNAIVLLFAGAASLAASVVFSAISCLGLSVRTRADGLHTTRRSTMTRAASRSSSWLVVTEIALAAMLLVGAGLTLRSLTRLMSVEPGFRSSNVLTVDIGLPSGRYATPEARRAFYARTLPALRAIAGVKDAGAAIVTPLTGNNWTTTLDRVDRPAPKGERPPQVGWQSASAGYFSALGIPLRAGRLFDDRDGLAATPPVIVSDEVARQFFPNENPLGRRIHGDAGDAEIVGVVGSVRRVSLADAPRADLYYSFEWDASPQTTLFIRTEGDPLSSLSAVRTVLQNIDPDVTIDRPGSLDGVVRESTAMTRLAMRLLTGFAGLAVALAAIGLYAVMAYGVRRRLRELGTRAALGARPGDLVALILRQGAILAASGLCIGLLAGMLSARVLSSVLFQVTAGDSIVLLGTSGVVLVTTIAACALPARRAGRVDPARTLASD